MFGMMEALLGFFDDKWGSGQMRPLRAGVYMQNLLI